MYYEKVNKQAKCFLTKIFYDIDYHNIDEIQKAKRVFEELKNNIKLVDHSEEKYTIDGIANILITGVGTSYEFAATYKMLLDKLGINCEIYRVMEYGYNRVKENGRSIKYSIEEGILEDDEKDDAVRLNRIQFQTDLQEKDGVEGELCEIDSNNAVRIYPNQNIVHIAAYNDIQDVMGKTRKMLTERKSYSQFLQKEGLDGDVQIVIGEYSYYLYSDKQENIEYQLTKEMQFMDEYRKLDPELEYYRREAVKRYTNLI